MTFMHYVVLAGVFGLGVGAAGVFVGVAIDISRRRSGDHDEY